jgi:hypothetical protein
VFSPTAQVSAPLYFIEVRHTSNNSPIFVALASNVKIVGGTVPVYPRGLCTILFVVPSAAVTVTRYGPFSSVTSVAYPLTMNSPSPSAYSG